MGDNSHRATDSSQPFDHAIAILARRQHGNITRAQLQSIGLSDQAIRHRVAIGRLFVVYRGVYAVGRPPVAPLELAAAAVLAAGPGAALSHASALAHWGLHKLWPNPPHVILTHGDRRPKDITVHRCHTLAPRDLTVRLGIRVTSPARTLLDSAPTLANLRRTVNDARIARLARARQIAEVVSRNPTHPGAAALKPIVARGRGPTRSEFEDAFGDLCARYQLPTPTFGASPNGHEVDAYFPQHNLIVELDGWDFHQDRGAFETDRERDAEHLAHGIPTVRITWERLEDTPGREARRLAQILTSIETRSS